MSQEVVLKLSIVPAIKCMYLAYDTTTSRGLDEHELRDIPSPSPTAQVRIPKGWKNYEEVRGLVMANPQSQPQPGNIHDLSTPAQQLTQHLLRHPYDLIDVRRLLRRFRASTVDFQQALTQVEHEARTR